MVVGRKPEQTLRAVLRAHVDRLCDRRVPEAQRAFFAKQIDEVVSRFDLVARDVQGFPDEHINMRILDNLDPVQQALVHYLTGQQYVLTNGITVPYAAPSSSGKAWMFEYVHTHHPTTAQQLMDGEMRKREQESASLSERGKYFEKTLGWATDGYDMTRDEARAEGRAFVTKTYEQIGDELIETAARDVREWQTAIADPAAHHSLLGKILDPMRLDEAVGETHELDRICHRVLQIAAFDPRIRDPANLFGHVQPVSLYAITDYYRLMPEERLATIAKLAR